MSVYVDNMRPVAQTRCWPYAHACHLIADSIEELHDFALKKLGLQKSWFQKAEGNIPHYDLTSGKRWQALRLGAIEITDKELVDKMNEWRKEKNCT
jgi:hypothetical protein